MTTASELLRQGRREDVWRKYCGFIDLDLDKFMEIQQRLLKEQIGLLSKCTLGRQLLGNRASITVEEFRNNVPLTHYGDYLPYFEKPEVEPGVLPSEPQYWARTSGRSSEYGFKWAPYSEAMVRKVGEFVTASFLMASCSGRGDVKLSPGDVCLYTLAPAPYFTGGVIARGFEQELEPRFIPSLEEGDQMEFEERIKQGFKLALKDGIDLFYGLSSVLVAIAEQFERGSDSFEFSPQMLHPRLAFRVARALVRSKIYKRKMLPKDLWEVKGIIAGGMDTAFYRDKIEKYWGVKPLEGYGGTEIGGIAIQAWNHQGMTFLPDCNFLEFISEEDFYRSLDVPGYRPSTRLLSEIIPGIYELVVTNFHGNPFVRYRTGDLIEITAMRDEEIQINLPQMVFHARADGVLDVSGFTRLTEKSVWMAIEETGLPYEGWMIRKEYQQDKPVLHLYIESKNGYSADRVGSMVHQNLKNKDAGYAELEAMLGIYPLQVTLLPRGAYQGYMEHQRMAGADMAHLKPPRINPSNEVIHSLTKNGS